jgi:hypothetical protein
MDLQLTIPSLDNSEDQCEMFVTELFQKRFDDVKQLFYDVDAKPPEHASLNDIVQVCSHVPSFCPLIVPTGFL